jgi:hypothetical protein
MIRNSALVLALAAGTVCAFGCKDKKKDDNTHSMKIETSQVQQPAAPSYVAYGAPMRLSDSQAVTISQVLATPGRYNGKYVRVSGTVDKVCPKKGCWLTLQDSTSPQTLFVKFADPEEGRLLPMDAAGKPAIVEGMVKVKMIAEADARHYAQDNNSSEEEIAKIVGPQKQVTITNGSARITGVESASASE